MNARPYHAYLVYARCNPDVARTIVFARNTAEAEAFGRDTLARRFAGWHLCSRRKAVCIKANHFEETETALAATVAAVREATRDESAAMGLPVQMPRIVGVAGRSDAGGWRRE